MNKLLKSVPVFLTLLFATAGNAFADYYVSESGNDKNSGLSPSTSWKTIDRVNQVNLTAGTHVLFNGDDTFEGMLKLNSGDRGAPSDPIVIGSYGGGRATILAGSGHGIWAYNTAGLKITDLRIIGSGWLSSAGAGIKAYVDLQGNVKLDTLIIEDVEVSGFKTGIEVGAWSGTTGFKNVAIRRVSAHDNREQGIKIWGYDAANHQGFSHEDVYIGYSATFRNSGPLSVGDGIVVSNIDGGLIERSVAYDNGLRNTTGRGPFGIWAWRSNGIRIQHNESYGNRTTIGGTEGGGFDLDGGVTNSIMQYNYSHDNDGPGYLLCQYKNAQPFTNNNVAFNISVNDGRKNSRGAIQVWSYSAGGIRDTQIYNNTIYVEESVSSNPAGVAVTSATTNVLVANNVIVTTGGVPLARVVAGQTGMRFLGNAYWTTGSAFRVIWGKREYKSLSAFRTTGQEQIAETATGFNVDPKLRHPGASVTFNDAAQLETLDAYKLQEDSPLIDEGMSFTLPSNAHDYFGTFVPAHGRIDIGAHEVDTAAFLRGLPVEKATRRSSILSAASRR